MPRLKTAAEIEAELAADPVFQEQKRQRDAQFLAQRRARREAEQPIVLELKAAGYAVETVWDFVSDERPTPAVVARILLRHLPLSYPDRIKEGIGRALAITEAHDGWDVLREEFENNPEQRPIGAKFGVGLALAAAADVHVIDEVIRIVRDKRHGDSRRPLLWALKLMSDPEARSVLRELQSDPTLGPEARRTLRRKTGFPVPPKKRGR